MPPRRALSIGQPYAELILRGIKTIEYRSRRTRIIGERFYIYAARTPVGTPGSPGVIKDLRQVAGALDHSGRSRSGSQSVSYPGPNRSCSFSLCVLCGESSSFLATNGRGFMRRALSVMARGSSLPSPLRSLRLGGESSSLTALLPLLEPALHTDRLG